MLQVYKWIGILTQVIQLIDQLMSTNRKQGWRSGMEKER